MNKIFKWTLITAGLVFLSFFGYAVYSIVSFFNVIDVKYSKEDLINNYNLRSGEITEVKNYFNSIVPENATVDIEFDGDKTLAIFHVTVNGEYDGGWHIKASSKKADTLLQKLGWTTETLKTLKKKAG